MKPAELLKALEHTALNLKPDEVVFDLDTAYFSREVTSRLPKGAKVQVFPRDVINLVQWAREQGLATT